MNARLPLPVINYKYAVDDYGELYLTGKAVTMKECSADEKTLKMTMAKGDEIKEIVENMPKSRKIMVLCDSSSGNFSEEEMNEKRENLNLKHAAAEPEPTPDAYNPEFDR